MNSQHIRAMKLDVLKPLVVDTLTSGDSAILSKDSYNSQTLASVPAGSQPDLFLTLATKIAQRDMELMTEASKYVGLCLKHDLKYSLENDKEILEVSSSKVYM